MLNNTSLVHRLSTNTELSPGVIAFIANAFQQVVIPILGILVFLILWSAAARNIETSLGNFPGPGGVWKQFGGLYSEHKAEREKKVAFYERQEKRNAAKLEKDPNYVIKKRAYTGKETFLDQIVTSLKTVMCGFLLAALIAIPFGIAIGLSKTLNTAVNPII